jgi:HD superfamily phosphohydrolase
MKPLLPEIAALGTAAEGVRIPPGITVPLTARVRLLIDTAPFRRLARISQLGLVSLVYPGARHSRFEHSLGVYRLALEFLARLQHDERFAAAVGPADAAAFAVASLLHDVGHWAFCHPIEDMGLAELPRHETLVGAILAESELADVLRGHWQVEPGRVAALIAGSATDPAARILHSLLSGPIDVDKMDYLARDSLHAGVPYGNHFDQGRLVSSLCLDEAGESLAITDTGRTAAELMVVARYVMFSEVYWHHAVRAATAMLQRAVWILRPAIDPVELSRLDDEAFIAWARAAAEDGPAAPLIEGLFGERRRLYKRAATFDPAQHPALHSSLAGRPYADVVTVSRRLAEILGRRLGHALPADAVLLDAPPAEREVEFALDVRERTTAEETPGTFRWIRLADLSPLVRSLAREQFDDVVKRVRVFAAAEHAAAIAACPALEEAILEAAQA